MNYNSIYYQTVYVLSIIKSKEKVQNLICNNFNKTM